MPVPWHVILWPHCFCPNDLVTSNIAPARPHATGVAVYPALFSKTISFMQLGGICANFSSPKILLWGRSTLAPPVVKAKKIWQDLYVAHLLGLLVNKTNGCVHFGLPPSNLTKDRCFFLFFVFQTNSNVVQLSFTWYSPNLVSNFQTKLSVKEVFWFVDIELNMAAV